MRVRIYEAAAPQEKELILQLRQSGNQSVTLVAVDDKGLRTAGAVILTIKEDGTLYRAFHCRAPGLQLDSTGRIKLTS